MTWTGSSTMLRWGQLRRWISLPAILAEVLLIPVPWLACLGVLSSMPSRNVDVWKPSLATAAFGGILLKWLSDEVLAHRRRGRGHGPLGMLVVPLQDLLVLGIWAVACFRRTVDWRGNRLRIGPGSRLSRPRSETRVVPSPEGQPA